MDKITRIDFRRPVKRKDESRIKPVEPVCRVEKDMDPRPSFADVMHQIEQKEIRLP